MITRLTACFVVVTGAVTSGMPTVVSGPPAARAEGPAAIDQLLDNARYWQGKGRPDKAAEAWRKILRSAPAHTEALTELALYEAHAGHKKEAQGYLERLRQAAPRHTQIRMIEKVLGMGSKYDDALDEARAAVRAGKTDEGLELYRQVFGDAPPSGNLGLEYYQVLGGSAGGWREARAGLERLAAENPGQPRFELAAARHLTYDESARREGIARLEPLLGGPEGAKAQAALRQALLWLGVIAPDVPLFERYLAKHPKDREVKKKLDDFRAGVISRGIASAGRERLKAGYVALEAGDFEQAEILFRAAVKANPKDGEAMSGLASALLGRERFDDALVVLRELQDKVAPKEPALWADLRATAEFWAALKRAETAHAAGRNDEAVRLLKDAIAQSPKLAPSGELILANALSDMKRYEEAEPLFEKLARDDPKALPPLLGLREVQLRRGSLDQAIEVNHRIIALAPDRAIDDAWLRAEILRRQAADAKNEGRLPDARTILLAAEDLDPDNREVLIDHVYLALQLEDLVDARDTVDRLLKAAPEDRDAATAHAWVAYAERRYGEANALLTAIKDWQSDAVLRDLHRRIDVQLGVEEAVQLAKRGRAIAAQSRLTELQRSARDSPALMGVVANAWADIGRYEQALAAMYDAINVDKSDSATLKLQLGAILHKARREREFLSVMAELEAAKDLTPDEKTGYASLIIAWSIRKADAARELGNLPRAFSYLQTPLRDYPSDLRLMNALGRLFISGGEYDEAYQTFKRVLAVDGDDREALEGTIRAAVELDREGEARQLAVDALRRHDEDPRVLLVVGRMHVMLGEDGEAKPLLDRALAIEEGRAKTREGLDNPISRLVAGAAARFGDKKDGVDQAQSVSLHAAIKRELADIRARHAIRIGTSFEVRSRTGEPGLGRLFSLEFPTHVSIPTGYSGRLTLIATPVFVDAGAIQLGTPRYEGLLGTSGVDLFGIATGNYDQTGSGIELVLKQDIGVLHLEIGSTPLGFLTQTLVGGGTVSLRLGPVGLKLELFRRAVEDSLMSWSGVFDPGTDAIMGGVIENGGRVDLGVDVDDVTAFVFGGAKYLHGWQVADNTAFEGGFGVHWRLYDWDGITFKTGLDGFFRSYEKNLRYFTLGHGGYFSPQTHFVGSVPLDLKLVRDAFDLGVSVGFGVAWFSEQAAPYYPTDPERMDVREDLAYEDDTPVPFVYAGKDNFAFVLDASATLTYRVSPSFELGARFGAHRGHDFEDYVFGANLTYVFDQKVSDGEEGQGMHEDEVE